MHYVSELSVQSIEYTIRFRWTYGIYSMHGSCQWNTLVECSMLAWQFSTFSNLCSICWLFIRLTYLLLLLLLPLYMCIIVMICDLIEWKCVILWLNDGVKFWRTYRNFIMNWRKLFECVILYLMHHSCVRIKSTFNIGYTLTKLTVEVIEIKGVLPAWVCIWYVHKTLK